MVRPLVLVAWLLISALGSTSAIADCVRIEPERLFERSDVVFSGVVESVGPASEGAVWRGAYTLKCVFQVAQVWKGPLEATLTVYVDASDFSGGREFVEGLHYMIYARVDDMANCNCLYTDTCWRPQHIERALLDRTELRDPFVVSPQLALGPPTTEELERLTRSGDRRQASSAKQALNWLREHGAARSE